MIVAEHLCGVAVAYPEHSGTKRVSLAQMEGRYQGSLVNFQKRKLANACEWMRTHAVYKPRIFVCTTSPKWGHQIYAPKIEKFCHNLRNGYGCENYVWVREFNGVGAPHYHFIADMDRITDPVGMSLYWSSLFGATARNAVRLGTKPDKRGYRKYFLESADMAFYMSAYIGKEMSKKIFKNSWHSASMPGRTFGISNEASRQSQPILYEANYHYESHPREVLTAQGLKVIDFQYCYGRTMENDIGEFFDKTAYTWTKSKHHNVYFGRKRQPRKQTC